MQILASPPSSETQAAKDRPMQDGDSDAEMADYGTDFSDDVDPNFDAEARPQQGPSVEITARNRASDPPFSRFWGDFPGDSRLPIAGKSR